MNRLFLALIIGILTASCATGADWSKPTLTDTYANFLNYLDARLDEVAQQFSQSTPTNQPTGTIRWSTANARWETWNGAAWVVLASKYMIDVDSVDGYHVSTSSANSVIPAVSSNGTLTLPGAIISRAGMSATIQGPSPNLGTMFTSPLKTYLGANVKYNNSGTMVGIGTGAAAQVLLYSTGQLDLRVGSATQDVSAAFTDYKVWSEYNDGAGSGLDADLLDGQHASAFRGATQKIAGDTVQRVATAMGSYLTGTALVPRDNTIPQNTEGTQVMTRAITPTSAGNTLAVEATVMVGSAGVNTMICSLFRSDSANALAVSMVSLGGADWVATVPIQWSGTANTTSAVTFSVRCGPVLAGTIYINGTSGTGALFNGTAATAIRVAEIQN